MKKILLSLLILICQLSCTKLSLIPPAQSELSIESDSVVFAIIGDYGEAGDPAFQVSQLVKSWAPDFILTVGDNNYDDGELSSIKENISQYYCDFIYNPDAPEGYRCLGSASEQKQNRFFPTLGNHDYKNANINIPFLNFFTLPGKETYYDFIWGPIHCFALNSGENGEASCCNSEQALWLKEHLLQSKAPYKLVYFHHAPYSSSIHGNNTDLQWPFEAWGASFVVSGHNHVYERISQNSSPDFYYFVNGTSGSSKLHICNAFPLDTNKFTSTCIQNQFGAIRVKANYTSLLLQYFGIDEPDKPLDTYRIEL